VESLSGQKRRVQRILAALKQGQAVDKRLHDPQLTTFHELMDAALGGARSESIIVLYLAPELVLDGRGPE
jgi:hypothetical protein